ncbi:MAG: hypothetical protein QXO80_05835 [Thermosphaera sp.]
MITPCLSPVTFHSLRGRIVQPLYWSTFQVQRVELGDEVLSP